MNKSIYQLFSKTGRILLLVTLVLALTLGTGQTAKAASVRTPVNLGSAAHFVILTKSGITNVPTSTIFGDMGVSPIASTAITGFSLVADHTNTFSTSPQVTGKIYAANYASPTPARLTTAISNMETAYADAAARTLPDHTELYAGLLGGKTLTQGLYKWSTTVLIANKLVLTGNRDSVFIFQISGNLVVRSGVRVELTGGVQSKNVFWQVAGGAGATIGTTARMVGTILAKKAIHLKTGAILNGRAFAQTAVTLEKNYVRISGY
jgi:hypothetical protein